MCDKSHDARLYNLCNILERSVEQGATKFYAAQILQLCWHILFVMINQSIKTHWMFVQIKACLYSHLGLSLSCPCIQINFKPFQQVALKFNYFDSRILMTDLRTTKLAYTYLPSGRHNFMMLKTIQAWFLHYSINFALHYTFSYDTCNCVKT